MLEEPSSCSGDEAAMELKTTVAHTAPRKGTPWSNDEHLAFLQGLEKLGEWLVQGERAAPNLHRI